MLDKYHRICFYYANSEFCLGYLVSETGIWEERLGQNAVKRIREGLLMSKAELARKAGVSPLTIDRVEKGKDCRMETKRKIILALGYKLSEKQKIFPED
jgi:DNA-binding XRE family transcriptional regulator